MRIRARGLLFLLILAFASGVGVGIWAARNANLPDNVLASFDAGNASAMLRQTGEKAALAARRAWSDVRDGKDKLKSLPRSAKDLEAKWESARDLLSLARPRPQDAKPSSKTAAKE
ncbi:MAG: hypothetical protein NTW86_31530 [Candidatus Sumerlaeota bacterium]|nr:hypothetical protein [Candidatus Sumerlaeota bacterium]